MEAVLTVAVSNGISSALARRSDQFVARVTSCNELRAAMSWPDSLSRHTDDSRPANIS